MIVLMVSEGEHVVTLRVITEVNDTDHTPPYTVRWLDNGHEALVFPGPDAHVQPKAGDEEATGGQAH